jgi:hypothetical protein
MRSILVTVFLLVIVVLLNGCNALQPSQVTEDRILLNQEGYFTDGVKYVLVIGSVSEFSVVTESGNALPHLLDELLYNLRWMLTMQDPADGGVYHKLTTKRFAGMVMPHEAVNQRYVAQKGTPATLDFAAVCAKGVRVLQPWEEHLPGLIDSCHRQAELAWEWVLENPDFWQENPIWPHLMIVPRWTGVSSRQNLILTSGVVTRPMK